MTGDPSFAFAVLIGLALVCRPLPTPIKTCLPSGVTATAVGYQPVGMNPFTWLRLGMAMSMTATLLLSALATKRVLPSARLPAQLGVLLSAAKEKSRVDGFRDDAPSGIDHRQQLLDAQATKIRSSVGCTAIGVGCSPTTSRRPSATRPIDRRESSAEPSRDDRAEGRCVPSRHRRPRAACDGFQLVEGLEIKYRDRATIDVERVDPLARGVDRQAAAKMAASCRRRAFFAGSAPDVGNNRLDQSEGCSSVSASARPPDAVPLGSECQPDQLSRTCLTIDDLPRFKVDERAVRGRCIRSWRRARACCRPAG